MCDETNWLLDIIVFDFGSSMQKILCYLLN